MPGTADASCSRLAPQVARTGRRRILLALGAAERGYPCSRRPGLTLVLSAVRVARSCWRSSIIPARGSQPGFTHATEIAVTIADQLIVHLLCMLVLPYSNWQWATLCLSESIQALRKDVQQALSSSNGCGGISRPKTYGSMAAAHKASAAG
jgi:hypothetical protein